MHGLALLTLVEINVGECVNLKGAVVLKKVKFPFEGGHSLAVLHSMLSYGIICNQPYHCWLVSQCE